jgi:hypothetical protein
VRGNCYSSTSLGGDGACAREHGFPGAIEGAVLLMAGPMTCNFTMKDEEVWRFRVRHGWHKYGLRPAS